MSEHQGASATGGELLEVGTQTTVRDRRHVKPHLTDTVPDRAHKALRSENSRKSSFSPLMFMRNRSSTSSSAISDDLTSTPSDDNATKSPSNIQTSMASRLLVLACTLLIAFSILSEVPISSHSKSTPIVAAAGLLRGFGFGAEEVDRKKLLAPRQNTNTDVCSRWSQQSALVNGTIYVYGGHATTQQGQTSNTWNNDFLTIDVTKTWDISSPAIQGLPQPSGPPPVSNGYLWNSYNSLFLYGGEFSDNPATSPVPFSMWEYDISSSTWTEHQNPQTSAGNNSDPANQPVQRAAEGAGISVPGLGRGYYFAGHLDQYTTVGWSNRIFRQYLNSLLEFTFPGSTNDGVQDLSGGKTASDGGTWRNVTKGGIQDTALFPNRSDSALVYVPGYGEQGILASMGGGTNVSFVGCP